LRPTKLRHVDRADLIGQRGGCRATERRACCGAWVSYRCGGRTRSRHRSAIGRFVGDGENARCFCAVHESLAGP